MLHGALVRGRSSAPDSAMLDWEDPPVGAFLCCSPLGRPGTEVEGGHRRASMRLQRRMLTEVRVGRRSRGEDRRFLNGAVRGRGAEQGQAAGVAVPVLLSGVETRSPSAHALHGSSIKSSLAQTTDFSVAWIAALFLFELPSSETNARRTHAHRSRAHRHPAHPPPPRAPHTPAGRKGSDRLGRQQNRTSILHSMTMCKNAGTRVNVSRMAHRPPLAPRLTDLPH